MKNLLLLLFPALVLCSGTFTACKRTQVVVCDTSTLQLEGIGMSDPGYDSVMVIRFEENSGFRKAIDTTRLLMQRSGGDTSILVPGVTQKQYAQSKSLIPAGSVYAGYDYLILFPKLGKSDLVSNIQLSGQTSKEFTYTQGISAHSPFRCGNTVVSCQIDTASVTTRPSYNGDSITVAYIHKW